MTKALDAKVKKLFDAVQKQKAELEVLGKPQWNTSCSLEIPGMDRVNIQVERDDRILVLCIGHLRQLEQAYELGCDEIGRTVNKTVGAYPIQSWIDDLKQRANILDISSKKEKLAELEKKLESVTSPEQRRKMEVERLEAEIGKL